jgi:hypothetical protein
MANALFDPGREGFLDGSIDWDTDDIRVMLVKSTYVFSAAHKFVADLGAVDNGRSAALRNKTVTSGVADATTFHAPPPPPRAPRSWSSSTPARRHRAAHRLHRHADVRLAVHAGGQPDREHRLGQRRQQDLQAVQAALPRVARRGPLRTWAPWGSATRP